MTDTAPKADKNADVSLSVAALVNQEWWGQGLTVGAFGSIKLQLLAFNTSD